LDSGFTQRIESVDHHAMALGFVGFVIRHTHSTFPFTLPQVYNLREGE
jgi:hypothetical protein